MDGQDKSLSKVLSPNNAISIFVCRGWLINNNGTVRPARR